jgi:hypothetical protein
VQRRIARRGRVLVGWLRYQIVQVQNHQQQKMKKQLTYISPLRAGIVLGVLYGILSLIFVPFILVAALLGGKSGAHVPAIFGLGFAIMMPVLYAAAGFIGGIIAAALYDLIAKWTGGFEFEVRDLAPAA